MGYHIRIKICGLTEVVDVHEAANLGVDAIGLNFHPGSPRVVTVEKARELLGEMPPFLEAVGVFVKKSVSDLWALAGQLGQISHHPGCMACRTRSWMPIRITSSQRSRSGTSPTETASFAISTCAGWLGEAAVGHRRRWPLAGIARRHRAGKRPWHLLRGSPPALPLILAGGLTPDNVAEAVKSVQPWGVDVASGVESSPGQKDAELMRRFIDSARESAV